MTTDSPPANPPRYRGLSGAIRYGLFLFSICLTLGILGGVLLVGMTGSVEPALRLVLRIGVAGLILSAGVTCCRWASCGTADRLMTHRFSRGDLGAFGLIVGLIVAGAFSVQASGIGEAVEVAGPTLDGKTLDLADYRGKVVLVDFWATWCPPCVAEIPNLKKTYERYHTDGFEVVAVSLDKEREALSRFVKKHDLPWPQIIFDEPEKRYWDNPLARQYGVRGIPFVMLVDREGKLRGSGQPGPQIEHALAAALGQPAPTSWQERLADAGLNLLTWMFLGLLVAPWWLLLLTCWAGALVAVLLELGLRRVFGRRAPLVG
jgi:peroxiredoxin